MVNAHFLKNEYWKQYASKLQKIRLNFAVLLVIWTLKTVGWWFLLRENGFVINHPLHMRVLPLVSCGPPWSPVVSCGVLCYVRCCCLPSCPLMCCSLSLCCRVVLCLYLLLLLCLVFALGVLYAISLCLVARLFTDWFVHCFVCSFIRSFACLFFFVCSFVSWC